MRFLFFVLIFLIIIQFATTGAEAQQKITGPWLWMIAPTQVGQGGAASTNIDSLAVASGGNVTEAAIAASGANVGDRVGTLEWTLGEISASGGNNINDLVNKIGLGRGDINDHSSYALITLESDRYQPGVAMRVGSDDSVKVWLNGRVVHTNPINRGAGDFQDTFRVDLDKGDNLLLVKVSERGGGWSMFVGINANVNAVYKSSRGNTVGGRQSKPLVSITPSPIVSPRVGEQFTISVKITDGQNVAGYQFSLQYDPTALSYVTGINADYLVQAFAVPPVVRANEVTLAATSLGVLNQGDGTLAVVTFKVLAVKDSVLTLTKVHLSDEQGNDHSINIENGEVTAPAQLPVRIDREDPTDVPARVTIEPMAGPYISSNNVVESRGGDFSGEIPLTFTVWSNRNTPMRSQRLHLTVDSDIDVSFSRNLIQTANTATATAKAMLLLQESSTGTEIIIVTARVDGFANVIGTLSLTVRQTPSTFTVGSFARQVTSGDTLQISVIVKSKNGTVMSNAVVRFVESSNLLTFDATSVRTGADGRATSTLRVGAAGSAQFTIDVSGLPWQTFNITITQRTTPVEVPTRVTIEPTTGPYISSNNIVEPRGGDFSGEIPLTFTVWSNRNTRMRSQTLRLTTASNIKMSFSKDTIQTANTATATAKSTLLLQESSTGTERIVVTARIDENPNVTGTLSLIVRQTPDSFSVSSFEKRITSGDTLQISVIVKSKNGTVMSNAVVRFIESSNLISFDSTSVRTDANGRATSTLRTGALDAERFAGGVAVDVAVDVAGLPRQTFNITIVPKTTLEDIPDRVTIESTTNAYISSDNVVEPKGGDFSGEVPLTFTVWSKANTRMHSQTLRLTAISNIKVSFSKDTIQTANTATATAKSTLLLEESSTGTETIVVTASIDKNPNVKETLSLAVKQTPDSFSVSSFGGHVISGETLQISAIVKSKNGTVMPNVLVEFVESSNLIAFNSTSLPTNANGKATSTLRTGSVGSPQFTVGVPGLPQQSFDVTIASPINSGWQSQKFSSRQGTKIWYGWKLDHYTIKKKIFFLGEIIKPPTVKWSVLVKGHGRLELESFSYASNWVEIKIRAKEHREKPTEIRVDVYATFEKRAAMPGAPSAQSFVPPKFVPQTTTLLPNYPNPFNPETWIPYQLAEPAEVTLTIYSVRGEVIRTLMLGYQPAGFYRNKSHAAYWDGRNNIGEHVASGIYFYTLTAGKFAKTSKMLIMK